MPAIDPDQTLRPVAPPPKRVPAPAPAAATAAPTAPAGPVSLERIYSEVLAVRKAQDEILGLLRGGGQVPATLPSGDGEETMPDAAGGVSMRARRRKTVLLIDDDEASRDAARAALEAAQVPTRVVGDGNAGLAAIAEEKPDVIVMELDISGSMAGKDVINMIKATMEWVDIPICLYTRLPIESQKEARTIHGADELVMKGQGAAEALVARVIQIFRRG
jgi:CheY-like chemotaxis protein